MRSAAEFAVAAGVLTLIPGPDTLLTLRTTISAGRASGLAAAAGICTALLGWGCAAGLGLTAVLAASPGLYLALRWTGAAYLAWLGLRAFGAGARWPAEQCGNDERGKRAGGYFRGIATCASNPKVGVFYLALLPQFIGPGPGVLPASVLLAGIHVAETLTWLGAVALLGSRLRGPLQHRRARRWTDRASGIAFLAFAARLAFGG